MAMASPVKAKQSSSSVTIGQGQQPGCHISWIKEMMLELPVPEKKNELFNSAIVAITSRLQETKAEVKVSPSTILNIQLMLAAFNVHLSEYSKALKWLAEATKCAEGLTFQQEQHGLAYWYLIEANASLLKKIMDAADEGSGAGIKVLEIPHEVSLTTSYDFEDNMFQAVIAVAKGTLANRMHCKNYMDYFRSAIKLDPETAEWFRKLYKRLRKERRKMARGLPPSKEEKDVITTAYNLDPDFCLNQTQYACMLDEYVTGRREFLIGWTKEEIAEKIVDLMTRAIDENPDHLWTRVRLAEIYGYGAYPNLDVKQGEVLFQECEERWPDSSMVLHKFGKYYSKRHNHAKALGYFKRSLDTDSRNFPCLMDYLKCLSKHDGADNEMLNMIEQDLKVQDFNVWQISKLLLAKGLILWRLGTEETEKRKACEFLVDAAMKNMKGSEDVGIVKTITNGYWDIIGKYNVNANELVSILKKMLPSPDSDNNELNEKKIAINYLIKELEANGIRHGQTDRRGLPMTRSRPFNNRRGPPMRSVADADNEWRRP